jgi:probable HAF family extracellular repeat protein
MKRVLFETLRPLTFGVFKRRSIVFPFFALAGAALFGPLACAQGHITQNPQPSSPKRHHRPEKYTITDLGTLTGGYESSSATAINDRGQIIGFSYSVFNGGRQAFLWQDGQITALADENTYLNPRAINDCGQIVGDYPSPDHIGATHAFLWQHGQVLDLGTLGGPADYSYAQGINNKGQIVGASDPPDSTVILRAFLWRDGRMEDLGALPGPDNLVSSAAAINDQGDVVGASDTGYAADNQRHAFLWRNGRMKDLGTIGTAQISEATSINERGQVAGFTFNGPWTAFFWEHGQILDIGSALGSAYSSDAEAINIRGQVVGHYGSNTYEGAFLWEDGQLIDLNSLIPDDSGWTLHEATGINRRGQIVGTGSHIVETAPGEHASVQRAFLLTPVPFQKKR